jgi:mannose-6-phosphate isomerase-like protein (cupin superfamily)
MSFNPEDQYVHLAPDGKAVTMPGGDAFWRMPETEKDKLGRGWLISEFVCSEDWPTWEMHPNGEEFVYLLGGDIEFLLELPSGVSRTRITERGAVVVPRGVWHTARVFEPSRMFFVTMGAGTQHKPVGGSSDQDPKS